MLNFITRFFSVNPTAKAQRDQFRNYFFSMPEHQWFDEFTKDHFEKLITHLQERLKRKREYVVFTLKKGLLNIENNRL